MNMTPESARAPRPGYTATTASMLTETADVGGLKIAETFPAGRGSRCRPDKA